MPYVVVRTNSEVSDDAVDHFLAARDAIVNHDSQDGELKHDPHVTVDMKNILILKMAIHKMNGRVAQIH